MSAKRKRGIRFVELEKAEGRKAEIEVGIFFGTLRDKRFYMHFFIFFPGLWLQQCCFRLLFLISFFLVFFPFSKFYSKLVDPRTEKKERKNSKELETLGKGNTSS